MGTVQLTDFGLAKATTTGSKYTRTGQALGTPAYMSPEQARGEAHALTPATDVWALGCILYELLAGRLAFEGASPAETVGAVLLREPAPLRRTRPDLPRDVATLVAACLAKSADARPASGGALRDDLERLLRGEAPRARASAPPRVRPVVAGAGVAAVVVAGWIAMAGGRTPVPTVTTPPDAAVRADAAWSRRHADPAGARAVLDEVVRREPTRADWRVRLGLLRWAAGDTDGAIEAWAAVPEHAPEATRAWWLRGLAAEARAVAETAADRFEAPRAAWTRATSGTGDPAAWARAGLALIAGDHAEARQRLEGESAWEATLLLGLVETDALGRSGSARLERCIRAYTQALTEGLEFSWAYNNRGAAHAHVRRLTEAEADFDRALALDPSNGFAWANRSMCRRLAGDAAGALADVERALALRPDHADALGMRSTLRRGAGDLPGALADAERAIAAAPRSYVGWLERGRARFFGGDPAGAASDLDRAIELRPDHALAREWRGDVEMRQDNLVGARVHYDAAIARSPGLVAARTNRAVIRWGSGDLAGALEDLDAAVAAAPQERSPRLNRGAMRRRAGDLAGALADYDAILARAPADADALANRANVHADGGAPTEARRDLEAALAAAPAGWDRRGEVEAFIARLRGGAAR